MCSSCGGDYEDPNEFEEVETEHDLAFESMKWAFEPKKLGYEYESVQCDDPMHLALKNTYEAYMRGLFAVKP
jgi:hypothetical protein